MLVKVLYDFDAQPDSSEITIKAGQYLTVTRKDVGEGWWEGRNDQGQVGLFPAGYVVEESAAATEGQSQYANTSNPAVTPAINVGHSQGLYAPQTPAFPPPPPVQEYYDNGDEWDDDWDDDDDTQTQGGSEYSASSVGGYTGGIAVSQMGSHLLTPTHNSSISALNASGTGGSGTKQVATPVRKSYNRFSTFVKSGGEDYILGTKNKQAPSDSLITIVQDANGRIMWAPIEHAYTCTISSFKKESKLKGLKSYIAYQLTPTFNNIQVSRRYKQFDWLHARMEEKFMTIPLPSLPDKQISGRYQECFIEHRMRQLRLWVNRVCRHPVLSQSDVWMHFLTCTDERRWKNGKRRAEADEFKNASFFFTIQAPNVPLETSFVEKKTENFNKFVIKMDDSVKHLFTVAQDECRKYLTNYKREVQKVAGGFRHLAGAFQESGQDEGGLLEAIKHTSFTYDKIAKYYEEQPVQDFEPMSDTLHEYKGLLAAWPEILEIHRGALNRKKEHQKLQEEGKIESKVSESVTQRADQISYAVLAEMNHFQKERVHDFKQMMAAFLQQQILFYEKIVSELRDSLQKYE